MMNMKNTKGKYACSLISPRHGKRNKLEKNRLAKKTALCLGAFEQAAVGMAYATRSGKWIRVNAHFCNILGYSEEELVNRRFLSITHPDDIEQDIAELKDLYAGKVSTISREKRYIRKDGTLVWVNVRISMAPFGAGTPFHICIIEDMTCRKLAENALRLSEDSLKSAQRIGQLGTWDWNIATKEFFWSTEIDQIFGMKPLDYESFLLRVHPDDRGYVILSIEQAHCKEQPYSIDYRIVRPDNSERIVHAQGEVTFDTQGNPVRMTGIIQDITERRVAEDRLRESEARFKNLSSNIPGMVFQLRLSDSGFEFTYISDGSIAVCGLPPDSIQSDPSAFVNLLLPAHRAEFHDSMRQSAQNNSIWNWEGQLTSEGTDTNWINLRATPRGIGMGDVIWDGVIFDISESKRNEAELRQSREKLRALSAHQIVVKEAEGKRIAREIHDELGQRLTVLRMDVLMLPKALKNHSNALTETVAQMKGSIDSILRIVRNIASHLRPSALDMGINLAVEWLVDDFQSSVRIPCEFNNRLAQDFYLDDERATGIFRILQESLTNVTRHANASRIEITLDSDDRYLYLKISDNGVGFDSSIADGQKTYGLSGMRERATAFGGDVRIASSPGNGTTVWASIPL
ncbi:sensor histidine kinase [Herbaspirillum sp. RV1423]|uniref:sensor histidine kinase n=1 Tax=Herbaspirillum sp. RV1423 TaxID=1443993 RepID=UPI0004AECEAE|nr:sensor histidine kinase [Herbaspirillum sp. RV1423]